MRNGITTTLILSVGIASLVACDGGTAPRHAQNATSSAFFAPATRHHVDATRGRTWVLTADGANVIELSGGRPLTLVLPGWIWVDPLFACPPDLALGPAGEAVITSNVIPTVWRVDPESLSISAHALALDADLDKDIGFSGLAYSAQHGAFFAASPIHGSLWKIDPGLRSAQKIALPTAIPEPCGLIARQHERQGAADAPAVLCIITARGHWRVDLAPNARSGQARAQGCESRPL
jgi:hypothetical protein